MVWLESPKSQLFKTFLGIENLLNIKEVMSKNVCVCSFPSSLSVLDLSLTSSTCFNIHSI